ncbi:MAG TPA: hypothetical protein VFN74_17545 [Chloroflexota bacterium]|nr:hypothetical protein [Chloroflexota bacterium]
MRRRALLGLPAALVASLGVSTTALPALASWQPAGMAGLTVRRLLADAASPGVLFASAVPSLPPAAAARTWLFKSIDAGRSWFGLERGLPAGYVAGALAVAPADGRIVLAGGADGLYRSTDAGATWAAVPGRFPPITALHISARNPRDAIAGTELNGNFVTADGGLTWRAATRGLPRNRYGITPGGIAFASHPTDPTLILMAAASEAPIFRSRDGGASWAPATGMPAANVLALSFTGDGAAALALHDRGLFRSTNGGESWQPVTGTPSAELSALVVGGERGDHVYLGTTRGALHRSTNGGGSWVELPVVPAPVRAMALWPATSLSPLPSLAAAGAEGIQRLALRPTLPHSPEPAAATRQYFPETGHNVSTFLTFFRARGALERFGPPRTEELVEDGVLVQYFQRARLEHRPEFRNTAYEIQISLLGQQLAGVAPPVEPFESSADQRYFAETGHSVSYAFLRHFNARGGIDSFGYPISEEAQENGRPVQYFQRARLEYRAELAGRTDEVMAGNIGDDALRQKGWLD